MTPVRELFIRTAEVASLLLARSEVAARWDEESALESFSVKGLAGHLLRGIGSVLIYLDRDEPPGTPIGAAEYYAAAVSDPDQIGSTPDLGSALHRAIRQRGEEAAAAGPGGTANEADELLQRLRVRLASEPEGRRVRVFKDLVLELDAYLVTRIVELVVHIDDLNASLGLEDVSPPDEATAVTIQTLVDVARYRHGDLGVMRALARRERDRPEALRVL